MSEKIELISVECLSMLLLFSAVEDGDTGDIDSGNSTSHSPADDKNSLMLTSTSLSATEGKSTKDGAASALFCKQTRSPKKL